MKTKTSRWTALVLSVAVVAAAGAFVVGASAAPSDGMMGGGHGMMMHGGGHGPMSGRMLERMLDRVDATAEQRAQIKTIVQTAMTEMQAQRGSRQAMREQAMALFTQPTVDARAAEELRVQQMARADAASKRMLQAMLDVSRVLTPEQRQRLAESMKQRHDMRQRHHRERQSPEPAKS
jgi:Spy/CpxP family protein refolding chaperone